MTDDARLAAQSNDPAFENILDELDWRGYLSVTTDRDELREMLGGEPITYYCGFDPTAPSLHLGHLVQLLLLRRLQLAGHRPLGLVGGSTGLIGDPRPTAERTLNSRDTVAEWVARLRGQIEGYLSFEGDNAARMVNNLDWTESISAIDFLRDLGKYFRVGPMLKREAVAARLASEAGISYTEFSYVILQSLDFLELYRRYDCRLQTGGQDQWGNLTGGVDLIRRAEGGTAHAIGTPLITNSDGTKFGKSEGNAIWIDAELTSPYAFYQFWLNTADADVVERLKVFTFLTKAEIEDFARQVEEEPFRRAAQKTLAAKVTELVHGTAAMESAVQASEALFGQGDLVAVDAATLRAAAHELRPAGAEAPFKVEPGMTIAQLLVGAGVVDSTSEARRAIDQGGVTLNKAKVDDHAREITEADALPGGVVIVRRGKKALGAGVFAGE
ncbi:Tyrosine--tRNA ligase [Pseudoclavibacter triregionum]|nr:Tyrosine--tRNA ligase [Pseudoclavibacter triregionum]